MPLSGRQVDGAPAPIVKDVSHGWNVNIGYAADGIAEITILNAGSAGRSRTPTNCFR